MACPRRWASLTILIYLTFNDANVLCQNILPERISTTIFTQPQLEPKREITQVQNPIFTKGELINALFSFASAKGLLSDTAPVLQSTLPLEQSQVTTIQNVPKTFNVVPLLPQISSQYEQKPIVISGAPVVAGSSIPNLVLSQTVNAMQPSLITEPHTAQAKTPQISLENYAAIQPSRAIWQIAQPMTEINNCIPVQPAVIAEATPPPINLQINPPSPVLPAINTESGNLEQASRPNFGTLIKECPVVTSDSKLGIPLNLQINIPSPVDPGPKITIITAAQPLSPPTTSESIPVFPPYGYLPPSPIIMRKSRSSLRKLLPLLLLTLFNDRGYSGGCGCSCNCGCDSENTIPIPYPIPIPINNPIINTRE